MLLHRLVKEFLKEKNDWYDTSEKNLICSLYAWRRGKLEAREEVEAVGNNLNGEFR